MGRTHPTYCKHGKMIDAGHFEGLEPCQPCEREAAETSMWMSIKRHMIEAAVTNDISNEHLGLMLRRHMGLPDSPPFTAESLSGHYP